MKNDIPRVIHYCWFGGNPLPESAIRCIESWRKFCPDYEIKEWNENNFDVECCDYVREAYEAKKWAFVSDYARFWILYHEGGLYFDVDVELIQSIYDIVENGAFMGCEKNFSDINDSGTLPAVNPGLGLATSPGLDLYKEILDFYMYRHFLKNDGTIDTTTVVKYTTDILCQHGLKASNEIQKVAEIKIYPSEYFCPLDYETGEINITSNTRSIHHYSESWHSRAEKIITKLNRFFSKYGNIGRSFGRICTLPFRVYEKIKKIGLKGTVTFLKKKIVTK